MTASTREPVLVAGRTCALYVASLQAQGVDRATVADLVDRFDLRSYLSNREAGFLVDEPELVAQRVVFEWGCEAAGALLWAVGLLDRLPAYDVPIELADVESVLLTHGGVSSLAERVAPRPDAELAAATTATVAAYRTAFWHIEDTGTAAPGLHYSIVHQRSLALSWLTDDRRRGWDDVVADLDEPPRPA